MQKIGLSLKTVRIISVGLSMILIAMLATACLPTLPLESSDATASRLAANSARLVESYAADEMDLVSRGKLRIDGANLTAGRTDFERNFYSIAFSSQGSDQPRLRRWRTPVSIAVEFGPSYQRRGSFNDRQEIVTFARRLAETTGHSVTMGSGPGNFTVLIIGAQDQAYLQSILRALVPGLSAETQKFFLEAPQGVRCQVVSFAKGSDVFTYVQAIALIRAELPPRLRQSCIHEELAQGLGLPDDDSRAWPSIFNDGDEFALLTGHDAKLLRLLYDPRLLPGMTIAEAKPIIVDILEE